MLNNNAIANDFRQTLDHFRRTVDQMFGSVYGEQNAAPREGTREAERVFSPAIESAWTDHVLYLRAIVPGVSQNDLKVSLNSNQLILEGERRRPEGWESNSWTQLAYGKFQTSVTLPNGLDYDKLNCRLHDGVLDISIPVSEARRPRQIQVQVGSGEDDGQKTISASGTTH